MQYDLKVPGLPGPYATYTSVDLPIGYRPQRGDLFTIGVAPFVVRATGVHVNLDHGIQVTERL